MVYTNNKMNNTFHQRIVHGTTLKTKKKKKAEDIYRFIFEAEIKFL